MFDIEHNGKIYELYNCPIRFITKSAFDFYRRYKYQKDYPSAPMPEFDSVSDKWIQASTLYSQKLAEFEKVVFDRDMKK